MSDSYDFGRWAEQQAVDYLEARGYLILERNYRYAKAEIDIIAQIGNILSIVEVKARHNLYFGTPESFVNEKKQRLMSLAANYYVVDKDIEVEVRFDIIAISQSKCTDISHIKNAFLAR